MSSPLFYLLPLAGYWLVLIYYLGAQWSLYEQYNYGWVVPFLCLYLIWRRKQKAESRGAEAEILKSETLKSAGPGAGGQAEGTGGKAEKLKSGQAEIPASFSFSAFQLFSVCLLCLLYAATRWLHEANPVWRLTSLLWTLEVIALTLLVLWSCGPVVPWSRSLAFPICFFLVAVPWPSGLETFLTQSLMRLNTATTVELLGFIGIPAVQHGNVIEVSAGVVGIDEACSGIRSLQAALMLSLFFGEINRLTIRRRLGLIVLGFVLAFVFNVGRTLLLTRVAAAKGLGAVAVWHDPAGVTILLGCFLCLWLIARGMQKEQNRKQKAESSGGKAEMLTSLGQKIEVGGQCFGGRCFSVSAFQRFSVFLTAWLLVVEAGTEIWYRSHERAAVGGVEWSVDRPARGSNYHEVEMPPSIRGQFNADEGTHLRWEDDGGKSWQAYYFRWFPAHSLKKRVAILLAKTHGPEKCLPRAGMKLQAYLGIITVPLAGMELAMHHYAFNAEGTPLHVFYGIYEDPTGSTQLANRRQNVRSRVAAALTGSRNYGQRFLEVAVFGCEKPEDARGRLVRELGKLIEGDRKSETRNPKSETRHGTR